MSTTYKQTVTISVWKEHTCACCDTVYRYLFKRKMTGEGGSEAAAEQAAENKVVHALENETDMHPCPGCGLYQPDMIANQRSSRHSWIFWLSLPVPILLFILVLSDVLSYSTALFWAALTTLPFLGAHLLVDLLNPNANLQSNRKLAKRRVKDGDLWVPGEIEAAEENSPHPGSGISAGHFACHAFLIAAVLCFLLPLGLRMGMGMVVNPKWSPEVAGPGDSPYVYFPDSIGSIKGYWNATGQATVLNAAEFGGPMTLPVTSKQSTWGNSISVKSSEKNSYSKPWARVQLPSDPRLAGKTLQLKIDLNVSYPVMQGSNSFQTTSTRVSQTVPIQLSSSGAGSLFSMTFWFCFLLGTGLLATAGGLLGMFSRQFKKKANKTTIFVPETEGRGARSEDDEEEDRPRQRARAEQVQVVEEEDRPRRRSRREDDYDDEEEDDRPRRRRRREDD